MTSPHSPRQTKAAALGWDEHRGFGARRPVELGTSPPPSNPVPGPPSRSRLTLKRGLRCPSHRERTSLSSQSSSPARNRPRPQTRDFQSALPPLLQPDWTSGGQQGREESPGPKQMEPGLPRKPTKRPLKETATDFLPKVRR